MSDCDGFAAECDGLDVAYVQIARRHVCRKHHLCSECRAKAEANGYNVLLLEPEESGVFLIRNTG